MIRHDKKKHFKFASLQSDTGQQFLALGGIEIISQNSFVLIESGKYYHRSTAALRVLLRLGGFWKSFYVLILVPRFIRDSVYNLVARNRYRLFGKSNECMMPTTDLKARFLD